MELVELTEYLVKQILVDVSLKFAEKITKIAPCYYVAGNHESRMPDKYFELLKGFEALGVTVLDDENIYLGFLILI